jgi:hypothetical protein
VEKIAAIAVNNAINSNNNNSTDIMPIPYNP